MLRTVGPDTKVPLGPLKTLQTKGGRSGDTPRKDGVSTSDNTVGEEPFGFHPTVWSSQGVVAGLTSLTHRIEGPLTGW